MENHHFLWENPLLMAIYRIRKKSSINHPAIGVAPLRKPQNMFNHWMLARLQLPLSGAQGAWEF